MMITSIVVIMIIVAYISYYETINTTVVNIWTVIS